MDKRMGVVIFNTTFMKNTHMHLDSAQKFVVYLPEY